MGLFGRQSTESAATASSSVSSMSPRRSHQDTSPDSHRGRFFNSRRNESPATTASISNGSMKHSNSVLHRSGFHREDPTIAAAREQVNLAEGAERAADKALVAARQAVKDAREHVKRLEKEAAEEARLAKIKQDQAASISKRAKPLGRHG
ncbi:hypothetical protein BGW36DRAFT_388367 [Talaromyces proteolyticus]|uniref:Uncharacterized protein n=1 Tax=Talaromyces proteolyticus TaxID=1131652 RepID=A0AAD4KJ34_9EURO|nr:uncharacterized protein BGW36DRAFT_388367 [Talaromyces proteolyticus]KAH8691458.1 hypothetical protein BGW36DRAFT_388367 [Talaromyces proteolyticus]